MFLVSQCCELNGYTTIYYIGSFFNVYKGVRLSKTDVAFCHRRHVTFASPNAFLSLIVKRVVAVHVYHHW